MQKYGIFVLQTFFCTINFTLSGILNIDAVAVDGILYVGFFIGETVGNFAGVNYTPCKRKGRIRRKPRSKPWKIHS